MTAAQIARTALRKLTASKMTPETTCSRLWRTSVTFTPGTCAPSAFRISKTPPSSRRPAPSTSTYSDVSLTGSSARKLCIQSPTSPQTHGRTYPERHCAKREGSEPDERDRLGFEPVEMDRRNHYVTPLPRDEVV
jgi:hypothetical protein